MKIQSAPDSVHDTPLRKSDAAATRWNGDGTSPATTGTTRRIQSTTGPGSPRMPRTSRCSVACWW